MLAMVNRPMLSAQVVCGLPDSQTKSQLGEFLLHEVLSRTGDIGAARTRFFAQAISFPPAQAFRIKSIAIVQHQQPPQIPPELTTVCGHPD